MADPAAPNPDAPAAAPPSEADLNAHLRHVDPDRWLAARLVGDPQARRQLLALYALNDELARVPQSVTQPLLGEMRFSWWREALEEAAHGRPRAHPVVQAMVPALRAHALRVDDLSALIGARHRDLERAPFADEPALLAWIDATAGGLMRMAAVLLDAGAPPASVTSAARAWAWTGLMRAEPAWRARGRRWTPRDWGDDVPPETAVARAKSRAEEALRAANRELAPLPVASFPAVAYVRLARDYLRGREPGELGRRARLLWASTLGRV